MDKNNVINILEARQRQKETQEKADRQRDLEAPVLDMTARRQEMILEERRRVKRTILTGFIGAFVVVPGLGLQKVLLHDISEGGLAFDMEPDEGSFRENEQIAMRVYLNNMNYFPFVVDIRNVRVLDGEGVIRHGANFVKGTVNDEALTHLVKFIECISLDLQDDRGDLLTATVRRLP